MESELQGARAGSERESQSPLPQAHTPLEPTPREENSEVPFVELLEERLTNEGLRQLIEREALLAELLSNRNQRRYHNAGATLGPTLGEEGLTYLPPRIA